MKNIVDEQVANHRRKKGKKNFYIECRLTKEGFDVSMAKHKEKLLKKMEWHTYWGKYEKKKDADNAVESLNKKQRTNPSWYNPIEGNEFKVCEEK
jgi:hypothetical protein